MDGNKIELISLEVLTQNKALSKSLYTMNKKLALSAGWHYILDWAWAIRQIDIPIAGNVVLDAGAGIGFLQWYLASQGARVVSVDRSDRTCIPYHLVKHFNVEGLTPAETPLSFIDMINPINDRAPVLKKIKSLGRGILGALRYSGHIPATGSVKFYNSNLEELPRIDDNSIDLIVSISALEHNKEVESIRKIFHELHRVLKPGGKMIMTLPASENQDWFFEPAYSWCFSDSTIRYIFDLADETPSNFDQYQKYFEEIKNSSELKRSISWRYYFSRNSGMPSGRWNPQYLPVGIVKNK